jgi:hypothetical protein
MKRLIKQRSNIRRVLAAGFLALAFLDLVGHAMESRDNKGATAWCVQFHYTHPGIDCPHKRDHQRPEKAFDEVSHVAVLLTQEDLRASTGIVYRSQPPVTEVSRFLSRSLEPPVQPPKQA